MKTKKNSARLIATIATAAFVVLAVSTTASAQVVRFGGTTSFADFFACGDSSCSYGYVVVGNSSGTKTALMMYSRSWSNGDVSYYLNGNGNIPVDSVKFAADNRMSFSVDTSAVPGFDTNLCFSNRVTQESGCSPAQAGIVSGTLAGDGLYGSETHTIATNTSVGTRFHYEGRFRSVSARGSVTILGNALPNVIGDIGSGQNHSINIEHLP